MAVKEKRKGTPAGWAGAFSMSGHGLTGMAPGMDLLEIVDSHMGVDLGRFQGLMTQKLLDMADRGTIPHHVGGTGVPEGMGGDVLPDPRLSHTAFDHGPDAMGIHPGSPTVQDKKAGILALDTGRTDREQVTSDQVADSS